MAQTFATWPDAFDWCRERDAPVIAQVGDEVLRIFPSGAAKPVRDKAATATNQPEIER
jgi:hypothetical protein